MGSTGDVMPALPQRRFLQAVVLSIVCHAAALALLPGLRGTTLRPALPSPLEVRLAPPLPLHVPEPMPAVEPAFQQPRVPEVRKPPPARRVPVQRITVPEAKTPARREPVEPKPVEPAVDRTKPEPESEPVQAPAPALATESEPPAQSHQNPAAEPADSLMQSYGRLLEQALGANQRYPRIARLRGWQGLVKMRVQFLPGGHVGQISILSSSGFPVLDETAVDMVRTAELPRAPDWLRNREFSVDVPVLFRLRG